MADDHPLVIEYRKTIPAKLENLKTLIEAVKKQKTSISLENLKKFVHKMAGNSGTYGFMKVSNACKNLEINLTETIRKFNQQKIDLDALNAFYENVVKNFQSPDTKIEL